MVIQTINGWARIETDEEWPDFVWAHPNCRYNLTLRPQVRHADDDSPWALMIEDSNGVRAVLNVGKMLPLLVIAKKFREEHTSWPPRVSTESVPTS